MKPGLTASALMAATPISGVHATPVGAVAVPGFGWQRIRAIVGRFVRRPPAQHAWCNRMVFLDVYCGKRGRTEHRMKHGGLLHSCSSCHSRNRHDGWREYADPNHMPHLF